MCSKSNADSFCSSTCRTQVSAANSAVSYNFSPHYLWTLGDVLRADLRSSSGRVPGPAFGWHGGVRVRAWPTPKLSHGCTKLKVCQHRANCRRSRVLRASHCWGIVCRTCGRNRDCALQHCSMRGMNNKELSIKATFQISGNADGIGRAPYAAVNTGT